MNRSRKAAKLHSVISHDNDSNVSLPAALTLSAAPSSIDNSSRVATTAWIRTYVGSQFADMVASAPATLDTLAELATALGNDPNFATTITTSIGTRVPQARILTINGVSFDLSADRSWTIAAGVSSFNTRTGAITLVSSDVTTALGYTPVQPNGTGASGTWGISISGASNSTSFFNLTFSSDIESVTSGGIYRQENPSSGFSYTTTLNMNSSDGRQQLTISRGGDGMKFRGTTTSSGTSWNAWNTVLHSSNYSAYSNFSGAVYGTIYYDSNDTGYYLDPSSSADNALRIKGGALHGPNATWGAYLLVGGDGRNNYINNSLVASITTTNGNLHLDSASGSDTYINFYDGALVNFGNGANSTVSSINSDGSHRPQLIYDYNNTEFYLDPSSTSFIHTLILSGTSYFRPNNWIQLDGDYGIYSSLYNSAHFLANTVSSYTQWRIIGSRGSYGGIYDTYSAVHGIMYDSGGNGGVYRQANGRWYWYYALGADCMGIGTSATSASYSLYLNKGVFAQSRIDATIFYDTNNTAYYVDPNGTSYLAGPLEVANGYLSTNGIGGSIQMSSIQGSFGGYFQFSQHAVIQTVNGGYHIYVLDASGTGVVKLSGSQSWSAHSDERLKIVHSTLENNLSKLETITPIYYSFNNFDDDRNRIGLIAQEVQAHFPELVAVDPKTDYLTLDYTGLIPVLLGAIKELKNKVETLETQLS
jgi:hypothetical protein